MFAGITIKPSGSVRDGNAVHEAKAFSPMDVTLSGKMMLVKEGHLSNALRPIVVTPSGIVTEVMSFTF